MDRILRAFISILALVLIVALVRLLPYVQSISGRWASVVIIAMIGAVILLGLATLRDRNIISVRVLY
jgi:putative effector of murein hydrolase LrgA (UPF0299 family)